MLIIIEASMKRDDRLAWLAAQYAAVAYHNPSEMPDDPVASEQPGSVDSDVIYVREFMKSLAERSQNGG
jgi:hypothetical protein